VPWFTPFAEAIRESCGYALLLHLRRHPELFKDAIFSVRSRGGRRESYFSAVVDGDRLSSSASRYDIPQNLTALRSYIAVTSVPELL
jgi:hypothetical protein